ncbi:MAG TPA: type II secretion system secretin GspD [Desulfurivibrionaceae bacterium]|nr:type II secretion system secretin GspD [Desulfurivibrionaceae bacterium]
MRRDKALSGGITAIIILLLAIGGCAPQRARTWVDLNEVSSKIEKKAEAAPVVEAAEPLGDKAPRVKDLSPTATGANEYLYQLTPPAPITIPAEAGQEIGLNFDNADIYEFIQVVGEVLGFDYIVDPQVKGVVNIRSGKAIGKENLYAVFKKILNINGVDIRKEGDLFYIYPSKAPATPTVQPPSAIGSLKDSPRMIMQLVPVMHLQASEAAKLIQPYLSERGLIHTLEHQNTLIVQDFESKVIDSLSVLARIDVSPLATLKVRMVRIEKAPLFQLRDELQEIMNAFKVNKKEFESLSIVPMERVNSLLLVSKSEFLLDTADSWIRELDAVPSEGRDNIYIYNVRNSVASELATLVNSLLSGEDLSGKKGGAGKSASKTTKKETKETKTSLADASKEKEAKSADTAASGNKTDKTDGGITAQSLSGKGLASLRFAGEPMLLSDDTRNVILIRAVQPDYSRIVKILERLDNLPRQVLIEVMVAEVSLTDGWEFGVEWALKNKKLKIDNTNYEQQFATSVITDTVTDLTRGGFSYSVLRGSTVVGLINAIASETDVSLLSSPQILVLNNEEASVNVGDQVPIVTTATERTGTDTPVIDKTVQYKDTGTLLTVRPRINYDGVIILDVNQQVSQASTTDTSGIDSPTISTREIKTKLAVKNGQSILMGGLIRKDGNVSANKVPLVGDIPLLGWLFKHQSDETTKTELLVMITPHVIESEDVLDQYIRQFQEKVNELRQELAGPKKAKKS